MHPGEIGSVFHLFEANDRAEPTLGRHGDINLLLFFFFSWLRFIEEILPTESWTSHIKKWSAKAGSDHLLSFSMCITRLVRFLIGSRYSISICFS